MSSVAMLKEYNLDLEASRRVKRLSQTDSEALAEIHKKCFDYPWSTESFNSMLNSKSFFGFAYASAAVEGFIVGKIVCDEIEIVTFCVLPQFRNRGVGKALIGEIDRRAKANSVGKIFLEVEEDNAAARKVYEDCGYQKISRRKEYYQAKERRKDAIVMMKTLFF